ncbi:MAG TPA: Na+/H+ antiporter NhaC family protein [Phycisphaerae bacterium]|nr:Na+/H+ antiporter NhaC family protein [Phycisphaerae bacterium]
MDNVPKDEVRPKGAAEPLVDPQRIRKSSHAARRFITLGSVSLIAILFFVSGQSEPTTGPATFTIRPQSQPTESPILQSLQPSGSPTSAPAPSSPAKFYGLWVLTPALLAIFLAIVTRQVIVALALGVLTAAAMVCVMRGDHNPLHFVIYMMDRYVLGVLGPMNDTGTAVNLEHITILIYTFFIGALIGVLTANGGTRALVERVTLHVRTPRTGQLGALGAGLLVFIDDYASAMIVGPGLRPVFDRLKLSREKLAHFVNWTAAPVSSMFLGTWLAVQIGWISDGLKDLEGNTPAFLSNATATSIFWTSIPYRTYSVLVLVALLLIALTGRDLGPMRKAERRAREAVDLSPDHGQAVIASKGHWILAALPGFLLIALTVILMVKTGYEASIRKDAIIRFDSVANGWSSLGVIFGNTDSHFALLYASLASAVLAIVMTVAGRTLSLTRTMEGAVSGMTAMFAATIILVLAWGLAAASKELQLREVAQQFLEEQRAAGRFSLLWLPVGIFATACLISFSTGTSWGTMSILLPSVVAVSAGLASSLPANEALATFHACVGAVMAGAVFGNTCSPLADVTVLSATFSSCDPAAHFRTVLPYALIVAIVSVVCSDGVRILLSQTAPDFLAHWNVWYGLFAGTILMLLILLVFGHRTLPPPVPMPTLILSSREAR